MQGPVWYLTVAIVLAIGAVFVRVLMLSGTRAEYGGVQGSAYRFRALLFWGLVVAGIAVAWFTLTKLPAPMALATQPSQIVNATGTQWYWDLDKDSVTAGTPVEFRVTSTDVNHGFAIYDENLRLVAQVQAMPGYVNILQHTFDQPGPYQVLCLEYCGVAHHSMSTNLTVHKP